MLDIQETVLPHANKTELGKDSRVSNDVMREFEQINKLDYMIYNYCKDKLLKHQKKYLR